MSQSRKRDDVTDKTNKIIRFIIGILFLAPIALYFVIGAEWTKLLFFAMLAAVSLYNLFFNRPEI